MHQATGIIIAGGRNTRMGSDKAFLRVGNETLVENVARRLQTVAGNIIIVTNRPEAFSGYGFDVVTDIFPGCGPLGGIHAGLSRSGTGINLVAACDMPFLEPELLKHLAARGKDYDVVIPRVEGYLEPLAACYNKSCLASIEEQLRKKQFKTTSFLDRVNVCYVDKDKLAELADLDRVFINVNTPRDLERALAVKRVK